MADEKEFNFIILEHFINSLAFKRLIHIKSIPTGIEKEFMMAPIQEFNIY